MTVTAPAEQDANALQPVFNRVRRLKDVAPLTLAQRFLLLALILSPMQKAFTIDAGFPLKPSELALFGAFAALAAQPLLSGRWTRLAPRSLRTERNLIVTLGGLLIASAINSIAFNTPNGKFDGVDRSLTVDALLYVFYGLMVLALWFVAVRIPSPWFGFATGWAVRLCTALCALQFLLWQSDNYDGLRRFGYVLVTGTAYGNPLPRNGPFMEGNYLGLFAAIALVILVRHRDILGAALAMVCLAYSQSTNALIALVVGFVVAAGVTTHLKWQVRLGLVAAFMAAAALFIPQVQTFAAFQAGKIGLLGDDPTGQREAAQLSRSLRLARIDTGVSMTAEHPLLGVGPGRWGVWFEHYAEPNNYPPGYLNKPGRAIVENGYVQIMAELGVLALLVVGLLFVLMIRRARRTGRSEFVLAVFITFAFFGVSSWTTLMLWFGIAWLSSGWAHREWQLPVRRTTLSLFPGPPGSGPVQVPTGIRPVPLSQQQDDIASRPAT